MKGHHVRGGGYGSGAHRWGAAQRDSARRQPRLHLANPKHPETAKIVEGDVETRRGGLLANLERSMAAAGGSLADVCQVIVFLIDADDFPGMNKVYTEFFSDPFPNRSTSSSYSRLA